MKHLIVAALSVVALTAPVVATAQEVRYGSDERYVVLNDEAFGDLNVVMQEVPFDQLPPFMQGQVSNMAYKCTGNTENIYRTKVYSYTSENTRRRGLPPSFIVDFLPLVHEEPTPCMLPAPCLDGMCRLMGFSAIDKKAWARSFSQYVKSWEPKKRPYPGTSMPQTFFRVKMTDPSCKAKGGHELNDQDLCQYDQIWVGGGLSILHQGDINPPEKPENEAQTPTGPQ